MNSPQEFRDIKNYSISDVKDFWSISENITNDFLLVTNMPDVPQKFFAKLNYFAFGILLKGEIETIIDNESHTFTQNSISIFRPNQLLKVTKTSHGNKGYFIFFTRQFLDHFNENIFSLKSHSFLSYGVASQIVLKVKDRDLLQKIFINVFDLLSLMPKQNWECIARNFASGLIYGVDNVIDKYIDYSNLELNECQKVFMCFKRLVMENLIEQKQVNFYVSKLNINRSYLNRIVKKYTGVSPSSYINTQLANLARRQLSSTTKNITEIAYNLNFCDPYTFSKFFKTYTGHSPTQFRKDCLS